MNVKSGVCIPSVVADAVTPTSLFVRGPFLTGLVELTHRAASTKRATYGLSRH